METAQAVHFNNKVRLKLPKARLYRTNSIAKELRNQGIRFEWFTKNSIMVSLPLKNNSESRRALYITGSVTLYKVRVDVWSHTRGGSFTYHEIKANDGATLIWKLVQSGLAPIDWLPQPPKDFYCSAQDLQPFGECICGRETSKGCEVCGLTQVE